MSGVDLTAFMWVVCSGAEVYVDNQSGLVYDISIVPTSPKNGREYCESLQACKDYTDGVGFNIPMQISPRGCRTLTCVTDGCTDAYHFPKDDGKELLCSLGAPVDLSFCPGGSEKPPQLHRRPRKLKRHRSSPQPPDADDGHPGRLARDQQAGWYQSAGKPSFGRR